ncbi:MAG: ABC transporter ATP-binding protein [Candidatus Peregrinibacteria bacterium]
MPALSFSAVSKYFGDFSALKSVSFSVEKGEFFALLGSNGAGKTTLIHCLSGMLQRTGGEILVFGKDPEKESETTKKQIGVVEQEVGFDPFLSPLETLRTVRGFFGMPADEPYLEWILERLGLLEKRHVRGRYLSGGMKRRLMIAKALSHEPEILILDEPTAGVDIELRQNLWAFLQELRKEKGITILLTTHYLEEAEALADRIAIIRDGGIAVCEEKSVLLARRKRILEVTHEDGTVELLTLNHGENMAQKIAQFLQHTPNIQDIHIREPRLEEVFLEITSSL